MITVVSAMNAAAASHCLRNSTRSTKNRSEEGGVGGLERTVDPGGAGAADDQGGERDERGSGQPLLTQQHAQHEKQIGRGRGGRPGTDGRSGWSGGRG